ncbi:hypothetical protein Pcinc_036198 [Petrolisthes cinctipes]|uniref:Uncharacterized protein n=1 Tax=Petrolisthes cinctipes TaxID=88211 RepID=A0AAE1BY99_PETCI|nr:hypothetical protein Pcinc_036198 [Petrolisthes cinctipes]
MKARGVREDRPKQTQSNALRTERAKHITTRIYTRCRSESRRGEVQQQEICDGKYVGSSCSVREERRNRNQSGVAWGEIDQWKEGDQEEETAD